VLDERLDLLYFLDLLCKRLGVLDGLVDGFLVFLDLNNDLKTDLTLDVKDDV
jgi:hypothetical protein